MQLSDKQKEFWTTPPHRWNIKTGATRSRKTWLDYYVIPKRIRAVAGKPGAILLLGNTKAIVSFGEVLFVGMMCILALLFLLKKKP